jgi:predicted transposase/invertase (TIGR01784 family)
VEPEHSPHDAFFKSYFGNPENLTELVKASFPASLTRLLDFSTLTIEPGTYIDEELQAHFSDLAASVQTTTGEAKVYVLVEHKSYHDPLALLQILRYMVRLWSAQKKLPLTPILPLLFYHGEKKEVSSEFRSLFDPALPAELRQYQPAFLTQILNLAVMDPKELQASRKVVLAAYLMKMFHQNFRNLLEGLVELLEELGMGFTREQEFDKIKVYLGSKEIPGDEDLEQTLEELIKNSKAKEVAMTVAEYFETKGQLKGRQEGEQIGIQKGRQEGRQLGRQEGRYEEKLEMAHRLKAKGMLVSEIAELTGLSIDEIRKL